MFICIVYINKYNKIQHKYKYIQYILCYYYFIIAVTMRQAQLSILDTLLKENSEFYALELITILWASDHATQCDKYHTTCYEDSPSRRMGIWKDFIEVVSVYPDLGLAKGPRERGRTFTTEVCKGPEGSKREAHGIFGWKGVC